MREERFMKKIWSARACGSCTACCKTHEVYSIQKSAGTWCAWCVPQKGCALYSRRPQECRDFQCEWLKGWGVEDDRLDRSNLVFDYALGGALGAVLMVREVARGALDSTLARDMTRACLDRGLFVCHMCVAGRKVLYVPENVELSPELIEMLAQKEGVEIVFYSCVPFLLQTTTQGGVDSAYRKR